MVSVHLRPVRTKDFERLVSNMLPKCPVQVNLYRRASNNREEIRFFQTIKNLNLGCLKLFKIQEKFSANRNKSLA